MVAPGRQPGAGSTPVWQRRVDVLIREGEDVRVVLALEGEDPVMLDGVGALVWDLLAEPHTADELVATFTAASDAEPDVIARDLEAFLLELEAQDLIERQDRGS